MRLYIRGALCHTHTHINGVKHSDSGTGQTGVFYYLVRGTRALDPREYWLYTTKRNEVISQYYWKQITHTPRIHANEADVTPTPYLLHSPQWIISCILRDATVHVEYWHTHGDTGNTRNASKSNIGYSSHRTVACMPIQARKRILMLLW